ncbi:MAG: endolytic transglycosylase MltG [Syntrophaceae bacterium]|nr:endolytic transglycosylase MltG [Syntrophaceae bacterium]
MTFDRSRLNRLSVLVLVAMAGIAAALWFQGSATAPGTGDETVTVYIPRGTPFGQVVTLLEQNGLVRSRLFFRALGYLYNAPRQVKAGEYEFTRAMTPGEILRKLVNGDYKKHAVTVPEGFTVRKIAARLAAEGLVEEKEFLRLAGDKRLLAELNIPGASAEGFLFPETYIFHRGVEAEQIIRQMAGQFWARVPKEWIAKAEAQGFSLLQWVTLASIIEKETGLKSEMPLVAAVFRNRLQKRMPLQSDPTVIYGIEDFDGNLTRRHLERQNPYNSYLNRGLPPGPICSPGMDALQAALNPAPVKYLYFVSRNDGSHHFSETLPEHSRAVRKYQINRKSSGN